MADTRTAPTMAAIFAANLTAGNDCETCCGTGRVYPAGEGRPPNIWPAKGCPAVARAEEYGNG